MSDKMRESFEKWAKSECLDTDSVDGFYSDNDTHIAWGSWQAAQSAAVPELPDPTTDDIALFEKVVGPYAYAGHFDRSEVTGLYIDSHTHNCHNGWQHAMRYMREQQSVPVVGDVVALICDDCGAETNDPWHSSKGTNRHYHRCDPCNSISTTELDALRKDAERYRWIRSSSVGPATVWHVCMVHLECGLQTLKSDHCLDEAIDAAIAGEKKAAATYAGQSSTACDDQLAAGVGEEI